MQRLTTILIVVTCIFHVNSYWLKDQSPVQPWSDRYQQTIQQKAREMSNYNKPSEKDDSDLENIFLSLSTGIKSILEEPNKIEYYLTKLQQEKLNPNKNAREISNSYKPQEKNDIQNMILSLGTGIQKLLEQPNKVDYYFDKYGQQIVNILKGKVKPMVKKVAEHKYFRKPQQAQQLAEKQVQQYFKMADNYLADILSSESIKQNLNHVVKKASVIYRAYEDEAKKKDN